MTKEEFIEAAGKRYDQLQALNDGRDFYDYEKEFINIWQELGREVLEKNINNTISQDRRKKKLAVATGK